LVGPWEISGLGTLVGVPVPGGSHFLGPFPGFRAEVKRKEVWSWEKPWKVSKALNPEIF